MRSLVIATLLLSGCAGIADVGPEGLVDLSHAYDASTLSWPTSPRFQLEELAWGPNESGDWYAANAFRCPEHGGTHLDAPIHFAEGGLSMTEIPTELLIGAARVIDVRELCAKHRDYRLTVADVVEYERRYGDIRAGDVVLVWTGWSERWPDAASYLGSDARGDASDLHFPGISPSAAHVLVERDVDMVGIDTASIDHGPSRDFPSHRIFSEAGVPLLENLDALERVPPLGAAVIALPMKIAGGTGGPCRVLAVLP